MPLFSRFSSQFSSGIWAQFRRFSSQFLLLGSLDPYQISLIFPHFSLIFPVIFSLIFAPHGIPSSSPVQIDLFWHPFRRPN